MSAGIGHHCSERETEKECSAKRRRGLPSQKHLMCGKAKAQRQHESGSLSRRISGRVSSFNSPNI